MSFKILVFDSDAVIGLFVLQGMSDILQVQMVQLINSINLQ